jgi:hypothetical protein
VDSGFRLDMGGASAESGVSAAMLSGRTVEDLSSTDRHVAVELAGARKSADPVVFYQLDQRGGAQ